jgi:hypothetical protein
MKRLLLLALLCMTALPWPAHAAYESLGRQEDTPNADGQVVVPMGCVRQDTIASSTTTDADYSNVKCSNTGRVYTSATIDGALPAGTNGIGKLTANGGVVIGDVNLVSAVPAGANAIGSVSVTSVIPGTGATNLGKAEDAAHVSGDTGVMALCVRHDTSTTGLGVNGDYAPCGLSALGEVYTASNTELLDPTTLADNMANPTITGVAAYMMCFDGTNWDRCLPGLSDTDDNSVAFSQITSLVLGATHVSDGVSWIRLRTYLEDVASAGGEQLTMAGAIRQDTPSATTSTDGDFTNLKTDNFSRLWVNCGAGCASGSTTPTDAFANPTTAALNMTFNTGWNGATWDRLQVDGSKFLKVNCAAGCGAGATTPTDAFANPTTANLNMTFNTGWNGASWDRLQVDGSKFLKVNCSTGCAGGATTPSDAFANPTTAGLQMIFPTGWNGATWDRLQVDGSKNLKVLINGAIAAGGNTIGTVNMGTFAGTGIEDAAETAGGTLIMAGTVRRDVAASSAGASADNATANTDVLGLLWTRKLDPCSGIAKTHIPINIATATTTELTAALAGASNHYYVCSLDLVTAAANNVALADDDSDGCGSVTSGLAGGTTAATGWNFAANGGLTKGSGDSTVFKTGGTNRVLCLVTSAATQLSGSIQVVAAP